jgi:effector-binding domain-containing protein
MLACDEGGSLVIGQPSLEDRRAQPYVGIRTQVPVCELGSTIPSLLDELFAWLGQRGIGPDGAPFIRYHVIDMAAVMDVELCVPLATETTGDGRVSPGVLPAGRYATLVYTGIQNGIAGNTALMDWGNQQGLTWDRWKVEAGDAFGSRYESFLSNPNDQPNPDTWETEVAIRLSDGSTTMQPRP